MMFKENIAWHRYMIKLSIFLLASILEGYDYQGDFEHILCSYRTWGHKQVKDSMLHFTF